MPTLTKTALLSVREERYRRRMNLRITSSVQAVEFVNAVGFCFLFPIQKVEMPSLWDAIAGRVVKTYPDHKGYEIERTWGWKDESLDKDCLQFKGFQPFAYFSTQRKRKPRTPSWYSIWAVTPNRSKKRTIESKSTSPAASPSRISAAQPMI